MKSRTRFLVFLLPALAMGLAACSGSSPAPTLTIRGTVTNDVSGAARYYQACSFGKPAPGTQIVVTDSAGKVVGTGTLGTWSHATAKDPAGDAMFTCAMPFTIASVPQEARYGFQISGVPGTIYETSVSGTVHLTVGSSS